MSDNPKPQSVRKRKPSDQSVFQVLNVFTARAYTALTAAVYRPLLEKQYGLHITAVGASINGEPLGLALATRSQQSAHILSIYVRPENRRQRIGLRLLEMLENQLAEPCDRAQITYATGPDASPLEHFLHA